MKRYISIITVIALVIMGRACYAKEAAKPDMSKYREVKVDRNNDGKIDGVDVYNEQGKIVKKGYDTNGDMAPDRWETYDTNTGLPDVVKSDSAYNLGSNN